MLVKAPWCVLFVTWDFSLMLGISLKVPRAAELHIGLVCVFCTVPFATPCKGHFCRGTVGPPFPPWL